MAITFSNISNFFLGSSVGIVNDNFAKVKAEFQKLIYRDGSATMSADLDMDSNSIINLADGELPSSAATVRQLMTIPKGEPGKNAPLPQRRDFILTSDQSKFPSDSEFTAVGFLDNEGKLFIYDPLTVRVELDGLGLTLNIDYTANGPDGQIIFLIPVAAGNIVSVYSYLTTTNSQVYISQTGSVESLSNYVATTGSVFVSGKGLYTWTSGDFTGLVDNDDVVKALGVSLLVGAWVKQGIGTLLPLGYVDGVQDDGPQLQALLDSGSYTLAVRAVPYRTSRQLFVPNADRQILHKPGVRFEWTGDTSQFSALYVCRYTSGRVVIGVDGDSSADRWYVSAPPAPLVDGKRLKQLFYPVIILSANNVYVNGITTNGILGIVGPGESRLYTSVIDSTSGPYFGPSEVGDNRLCSNIHFADCDGGFDEYTDANEFLYFNFTDGFSARNIKAFNVTQGVVWWGGDSAGAEGAIGMPRLCRNGYISNCLVDGCGGAGVWGSMGQRIRVRDSEIRHCADVGFDAEGCVDVEFSGCTADNATNGTFTTYYSNDNVRFVNVVSYQDTPGARHVAVWTAGAPNNRNVFIDGIYCENRNGIGSTGTDPASVDDFRMHNAELVNVICKAFAKGSGTIEMTNVSIKLMLPVGVAAVQVGNVETPQPSISLRGFRIRSTVDQAADWSVLQINDSGNAPFTAVIRDFEVRVRRADGTEPSMSCFSFNKGGAGTTVPGSSWLFSGNFGISSISVKQTNSVPVFLFGGLNFTSRGQAVGLTLIPYVPN